MNRHRAVGHRWSRRIGSALLALLVTSSVAGAAVVYTQHLKLEPVLSGSMRPGIQPGDLAVLRPIPVSQLHTDDIIAYLPPGQTTPVLHRITSINSEGVTTKGDANSEDDPWGRVKPQSATVERLVTVAPKIGFLIDVRQQLLAVAGGVLLLALAGALWSWGHEPRSQNRHGGSARDAAATAHTTQGEVIK